MPLSTQLSTLLKSQSDRDGAWLYAWACCQFHVCTCPVSVKPLISGMHQRAAKGRGGCAACSYQGCGREQPNEGLCGLHAIIRNASESSQRKWLVFLLGLEEGASEFMEQAGVLYSLLGWAALTSILVSVAARNSKRESMVQVGVLYSLLYRAALTSVPGFWRLRTPTSAIQ
eukprot:scaffold93818_cov20-Tisochrysis_lutea.AAC.1